MLWMEVEEQAENLSFDFHVLCESRLLQAVLGRAIADVLGESLWEVCLRDRLSAKRWIFQSQDRGAFSFYWICEKLDIPVDDFRSCVKRALRDQVLKKRLLWIIRRGQFGG